MAQWELGRVVVARWYAWGMDHKSSTGFRFTSRDLTIMSFLNCHPLTSAQMLSVSQTFEKPFRVSQILHRRLGVLRTHELIRNWPLASRELGGSPHYWKLTRTGYRLLNGEDCTLPKRRYFEEIAIGHHAHTYALGEFLTHIYISAHQAGISIEQFARENSVKIQTETGAVYPDCSFQLVDQNGRTFNYCVELDNGTERVRSKQDVESLERKMRTYEVDQRKFSALDPNRYLVLFITTRSKKRTKHILELAGDILGDSQRTVFLAASLEQFMAGQPFQDAILEDHKDKIRTLISPSKANSKTRSDRRSGLVLVG